MFRQMRRAAQQLSFDECASILQNATSGTLALCGAGGYPYAVPLSFVFVPDATGGLGKIYFHSANVGHKIDAIKSCGKSSFCVVAQDCVVPLEYTTRFKSVIAFGTVRIIDDEAEKRRTVEILGKRYAPNDSAENRAAEIDKYWGRLSMMEMQIEHLSGKQSVNPLS